MFEAMRGSLSGITIFQLRCLLIGRGTWLPKRWQHANHDTRDGLAEGRVLATRDFKSRPVEQQR